MGGYVFIIIFILLGVFLGVTTRFFTGFGENLGWNRMKELGLDEDRSGDDEPDSRLK